MKTAYALKVERDKAEKEESQTICAHFGCGKKLSLPESLAGNYCTNHSGKERVDIMKILKFK